MRRSACFTFDLRSQSKRSMLTSIVALTLLRSKTWLAGSWPNGPVNDLGRHAFDLAGSAPHILADICLAWLGVHEAFDCVPIGFECPGGSDDNGPDGRLGLEQHLRKFTLGRRAQHNTSANADTKPATLGNDRPDDAAEIGGTVIAAPTERP